MCNIYKLKSRRKPRTAKQNAKRWAKANQVDLKTWPGGLKDFAEAMGIK